MRMRLGIIVVAFAVLSSGTAHAAGSVPPPYVGGFEGSACEARSGARCVHSASVNPRTGAVVLDDRITAALAPSGGVTFGLGGVFGAFYLNKARKSLPVTVTVTMESATAATPIPVDPTGSFAAVMLFAGGGSIGCETCTGFVSRAIVMQGPPPATALPAIPPAVPGMPAIPPKIPAAPAVNLPGQAGPITLTLKFSIVARKGLIPAGVIVVGLLVETIAVLGGGAAGTPPVAGQPAQPIPPAFMGNPKRLDQVGTSRAAARVKLVKISY